MAAMNFPPSPVNGETYTNDDGVIYTYSSTESKWKTTVVPNNLYLPLTGGTLSGNLSLGTNDLTVGDVTASGTASLSGLTYPTSDGTSGQYLQTNGSGTLSFQTVATPTNITVGTAADLTSQGSIVYSSIPSGTKRITVLISDLCLTATSYRPTVRIGSGGSTVSTGYVGRTGYNASYASPTTGFEIYFWGANAGAGQILSTIMTIENIDGNTWVESHVGASSGWGTIQYGSFVIDLGGTLDTLELTTTSTGTFSQGTVNVYYEAA